MKSRGKSIRLKRQSYGSTALLATTLARVTEMVNSVTPEEATKYCCREMALVGGDPSGSRTLGFPGIPCPYCGRNAPTTSGVL